MIFIKYYKNLENSIQMTYALFTITLWNNKEIQKIKSRIPFSADIVLACCLNDICWQTC